MKTDPKLIDFYKGYKIREKYLKQKVGDITIGYFNSINKSAINRQLDFNLDQNFLWELFIKQQKKCALSGINIHITKNNGSRTASLDRIDSSKGYTKDNVQWVHKWINLMKSDFIQEEFIQLCKAVADHNKGETC